MRKMMFLCDHVVVLKKLEELPRDLLVWNPGSHHVPLLLRKKETSLAAKRNTTCEVRRTVSSP
jgi:hypothetical protein